ncbi:MAG: hypothetical protein K6F94_05370 [Bacteroidaceae bacterium]|nr:hypothetical protein [Bacteroidaceae bacterium]
MNNTHKYISPAITTADIQPSILATSSELSGPTADYISDPDICNDCEIKGEIEGGTSMW